MLDIKFIREHLEEVKKGVANKKVAINFDEILALDQTYRKELAELESFRSEQNKANDQISQKKAKKEDASMEITSMKSISQKVKEYNIKVGGISDEIAKKLLYIPNIPSKDTPIGPPETANKVVKTWGDPKKFDFKPKNHQEIGEKLGLDMKKGAKLTGSGFYTMIGHAAKLERVLLNIMLGHHTKNNGYIEVSPPHIVNRETITGTGQLPKLEDDMYRLEQEDFFLIPTAEVPVTNLYRGETLKEEDLPIKHVAFTPCFRREAGSYGRDTKGLSRVHQFDKVELVKFVKPEDSEAEHEELLKEAEGVLQMFGLPYRVLLLSTEDLSFAAHKCYDIEVWAPGQGTWLEVSSCSNFTDFQSRRIGIKVKRKEGGKPELVHTLNASGVALPRLVIALWENYQTENGSVEYPEVIKEMLEKI